MATMDDGQLSGREGHRQVDCGDGEAINPLGKLLMHRETRTGYQHYLLRRAFGKAIR